MALIVECSPMQLLAPYPGNSGYVHIGMHQDSLVTVLLSIMNPYSRLSGGLSA